MDNLPETVQADTVCKRQEDSCRGKVGLVQWDITDNSAVDSKKTKMENLTMKKFRCIFLPLGITIFILSGCQSETNCGAEYLPLFTAPKQEVFDTLGLSDEDMTLSRPDRPDLNSYRLTDKKQIHGLDFTVSLLFTGEAEPETNFPYPPDVLWEVGFSRKVEISESAEEDFLVAEKLREDMIEQYGEPTDHPWHVRAPFSDLDSVFDIRDGKSGLALDWWDIPVPEEWKDNIDSERYYLEAVLSMERIETSCTVTLKFMISLTEEEIQRQADIQREPNGNQ